MSFVCLDFPSSAICVLYNPRRVSASKRQQLSLQAWSFEYLSFCLCSWLLLPSEMNDLSFYVFLFVYSVCSNQHQQMVDSLIYNIFKDNDRELSY